jgi:TolB-like protein
MILMFAFTVVPVWAGHVVTPELRAWAKQAVSQEKELRLVTKPQTVAVLYFANPGDDVGLVPLQKGLAVMLMTDLAQLDMLTVIERTELQALVEELGFGQSGLVDEASAPRVGRLLQTEFIIGGQVRRTGDGQLDLSATVLEVGPGKVVGRARARGNPDRVFDLEKQLLDTIIPAINIVPSPRQKKQLAKPLAKRPEAAMALFEGMDAADKHHFEEASRHYGSALNIDPKFKLARQSLKELTTLKLAGADVTPPPPLKRITKTQRKDLLRSMRNRTSLTTGLTPSLPDSRIPVPAEETREQ